MSKIEVRYVSGRRTLHLQPAFDGQSAWSPDGTRLVFGRAQDGGQTILAHSVADGRTRSVAVGHSPVWSRNGESITFLRGGALFVIRASGGSPRLLVAANRKPSCPTWSADSTEIAYASAPAVWRIRAAGGDPRCVTPTLPRDPDEAELRGATCPRWSPDGSRIAFVAETVGTGDHVQSLFVVRPDGTDLREFDEPAVRPAGLVARRDKDRVPGVRRDRRSIPRRQRAHRRCGPRGRPRLVAGRQAALLHRLFGRRRVGCRSRREREASPDQPGRRCRGSLAAAARRSMTDNGVPPIQLLERRDPRRRPSARGR